MNPLRPSLAASIALNIALVAVLAWALAWRKPALVAQALPPQAPAAEPLRPMPAPAAAATFHWRQLDAPDFATYAQNLRGIGCPEATIRDIIQAELREIYELKRAETRQALAAAPETARAVLEARLQNFTVEESAALAAITAVPEGGAPAVRSPPAASQLAGAPASTSTVLAEPELEPQPVAPAGIASTSIPVVFEAGTDPSQPASVAELPLVPTDPALNAPTAALLTGLRQDFASNVAAAGVDTSSEQYHQQWLQAQRRSDETFSSLFGGDTFVRMQIQAARKQHAAQKAQAR